MKIFLVEDDAVIAAAIKKHLAGWGYEVRCAGDFQHVMEAFDEFQPHLVLLDISLPFFNGYHWCREIRKVSKAPILFLSSAADNMNVVMAVSMGGDDFVPKPFDLEVLTAKIQALLRRSYDFAAAPVLSRGGVTLDLSAAVVECGGKKLDLSRNEFRILQVLMENAGRAVSRETLMLRLWETDSFVDENTLSVNINRLRRKLSGIGLTDFVKTKKGFGYLVE